MRAKNRHGLFWIVVAVLLLLGGGSVFWWRQTHTLTLGMYEAQIERIAASEEYEQALSLCNQALKAYPAVGELYSQKAAIYQALGRTDLAIQTLDYGYKQTHLEDLREQRERYDETVEEDVEFHPVEVGSAESQQEEEQEEYQPYVLPQVTLPNVPPPQKDQPEEVQPGEDSAAPVQEDADASREEAATPAQEETAQTSPEDPETNSQEPPEPGGT